MINEIKYIFDLYKRQGNRTIDSIMITGGSSYLPNLVDYLQDLSKKNINTYGDVKESIELVRKR